MSVQPHLATVVAMPTEPVAVGSTAAAVTAELTDAGRLSTVHGQAALALAASLDSPNESGSAKAALARQLAATMELALAGVKRGSDSVDELAGRRATRRA